MTIREVTVQVNVSVIKSIIKIAFGNLMNIVIFTAFHQQIHSINVASHSIAINDYTLYTYCM